MRGNNYLRPLLGLAVLLLLEKFSVTLIAEPWADRKMEKAVNDRGGNFHLKNKRTDDTTRLVEQIKSFFVNRNLSASNPLPGKGIRTGIIDYDRDPERFLFGYCFKSILSGIKSSLANNPGGKS
jgi:hypothetical protein